MKHPGLGLIVVGLGLILGGCVAAVIGNAPQSGTAADPRERSGTDADAALSAAVSGRLGANAALSHAAIGVSAQDGMVTLRGRVGSEALRASAERIARAVAGVVSVHNQLQVY
jgi:osmotically-inducible protein OsmY